MGSPSRNLNVLERFRPWVGLGLTHCLQKPPDTNGSMESSCTDTEEHVGRLSSGPFSSSPGSASPRSGQATPLDENPPPWMAARDMNLSSWPAPWDFYWSKINPKARLVWTYSGLCHDLLGLGDPNRGRMWRSILATLAWPPGTTTFWPCSEPRGSKTRFTPEMFWHGMSRLPIRGVVCFGQSALDSICPDSLRDGSVIQAGNVRVLPMPGPSALLNARKSESQELLAPLLNLRLV